MTSLGGLLGLAVQTPIGGLIDVTQAKRALIVAALMVLSAGAVTIYAAPIFWPVMIANCLIAIVGDVFGPAVAALTLGLYPRAALARRMGRNSAFDHGGNVAIAAAAGFVGWALSQRAVFLLVPFFAVLAGFAVLSIPARAIDHVQARGGEQEHDGEPHPSGLRILLTCRPLLLYAGCAMLFHFANAPLLPLVGQKLALIHKEWATAMMSACIIAAQMIMLPIALLVGRTADHLGAQADPADRVWYFAGARRALYPLEQQRLADRSAIARRDRRRDFRRDYPTGPRRFDARHRALQCGARSGGHRARNRRLGERARRRADRRSFRVFSGVSDLRSARRR